MRHAPGAVSGNRKFFLSQGVKSQIYDMKVSRVESELRKVRMLKREVSRECGGMLS